MSTQHTVGIQQQQHVRACFSLLSCHSYVLIFDWMLTSDERCVLYETHKRARNWLSSRDPVPNTTRPPLYAHKFICVSGGLVDKWSTMCCYPRGKPSLRTCNRSSLNVCKTLEKKSQHLVNPKSILFLHELWHVARAARDTTRRFDCAIYITPRTFHQQINILSNHFMWNPSQMRQTWGKHSVFLRPRHLILQPRYCTAGDPCAKVSECRWILLWQLTVGQICCIIVFFLINNKRQGHFFLYDICVREGVCTHPCIHVHTRMHTRNERRKKEQFCTNENVHKSFF